MSEAGGHIVDNTKMIAAGAQGPAAVNKRQGTMSDIFNLGSAYEATPTSNGLRERNPLSTADINGGAKVNRFGQKMFLDERLAGQAAGQLKQGSMVN